MSLVHSAHDAAISQLSRRSHSPQATGLPDYAENLLAYHAEFASELQGMVAKLPLSPGDEALEVAAGDGQFTVWLGNQVGQGGAGQGGKVTAIDVSRAWLREAEETVDAQAGSGAIDSGNIELKQADATKLPFDDESFDFVWCAQSLYSLPRLNQCLAEMKRVLRMGGNLAILENDSLHHVLLPWPVDLELQIHTAELRAFREESSQPSRFYAGRWLSRLLRKHGLRQPQERSYASTRQYPLTEAGETYFRTYLHALRNRVEPWLSKRAMRRLEAMIDPEGTRCLWKQPDFVAVVIDRVVWAQRARRAK
jgi:ubiquinone/menaquinone biosynthesis C-methylase UbiE